MCALNYLAFLANRRRSKRRKQEHVMVFPYTCKIKFTLMDLSSRLQLVRPFEFRKTGWIHLRFPIHLALRHPFNWISLAVLELNDQPKPLMFLLFSNHHKEMVIINGSKLDATTMCFVTLPRQWQQRQQSENMAGFISLWSNGILFVSWQSSHNWTLNISFVLILIFTAMPRHLSYI